MDGSTGGRHSPRRTPVHRGARMNACTLEGSVGLPPFRACPPPNEGGGPAGAGTLVSGAPGAALLAAAALLLAPSPARAVIECGAQSSGYGVAPFW